MELKQVIDQFAIDGKAGEIEKIGSGHINATYRIKNQVNGQPDYLLQSINGYIFTNIEELTNNIIKVTSHIRKKYSAQDAVNKVLTPVATKLGTYYYTDEEKTNWRVFVYIPDSRIYDVVSSKKIAFEAGKAFGNFQSQLSDYPASQIFEVLPRFHDAERRLGDFMLAVKENKAGRLESVQREVAFVMQRAEEMKKISKLEAQGLISKRIAHYDTKCSNILYDATDDALCVIDLDTVMPGFVMYDFGDSIRTFANTATEDEADLSKISINLGIYEAYAKGYLLSTRGFLTSVERDHLAFAAKYITFEQAVRFLTDYINGDLYYHIKFPGHNLQRSRAQLKLVESMEENFAEMEHIISETYHLLSE